MNFEKFDFKQRVGFLLLATYIACIPATLISDHSEGYLSVFSLAAVLGMAIIPFIVGLVAMFLFGAKEYSGLFYGVGTSMILVALVSYGPLRDAGLLPPP